MIGLTDAGSEATLRGPHMRLHSDVRSQLDAAFGNVESALKNLSERLDDVLPDYGRQRKIARARRAIRRTASSVVERVRPHEGGLMEDTRRTVREHPFGTLLTAAAAGFFVWSLFRIASSRHEGSTTGHARTLAGRFREAQEEGVMRH